MLEKRRLGRIGYEATIITLGDRSLRAHAPMEKRLEAEASRWYPHQFRKPLNAFLSILLSFLSHSPLLTPLYGSPLFNMKKMIRTIS